MHKSSCLFDPFTAFYNCMTWNVRKLISPPFQCTSITNRVITAYYNFDLNVRLKTHISDPFYCTSIYNCMTWNVRKLISPPFQCTSITNRVINLFDRFTAYYNCMTWNVRKLISPPFQCTSITNRVLSPIWPFYGLLQLYDLKCQKTHYLRHFSAQVSQIVFFAYLTVLRLLQLYDLQKTHISTISVHNNSLICWQLYEMSENSYLRHFSAQVSEIVFFAYLTIYYNCMTWDCQKTHISATSVHKYQSFWLAYLTFYGLLQLYDQKYSKLTSPPFQCISNTNRVLSLFDCFRIYYNCMTRIVRNFISPPFQCTSITNRVLTLFDRLTPYYNCMTWNVRKLISPPFKCTNITNRDLSLIHRFTAYYNCMT